MNTQSPEAAFASLVLPQHALEWFNITSALVENDIVCITLAEKDNPPPSQRTLRFKGYKDITVTDFPIRGKQASLTFRRRYWQERDTKKLLANDIPLAFPGTKLEHEFANFLKGEGGRSPYITHVYRDRLLPTTEGI